VDFKIRWCITRLDAGVLSFLVQRGVRAPDRIPLVCNCEDAGLGWCRPPVAYFKHADDRRLQTPLHWVKRMAQGEAYTKQTDLRVDLVEGGTLGPAWSKT